MVTSGFFMSYFPDLGVGVGFRSFYYDRLLQNRPPETVHWVEAITENFLPWDPSQPPHAPGRPLQNLLKVRQNLPVALHGVSLSLGSVDPLNVDYLDRFKTLIDTVEPCWVSDHLSWSSFQGETLHDLLPLPYTMEVAVFVAEKISRVQEFLKRRILIENVSTYVQWLSNEMPEWDFVREVVQRSGCGLLLDVNNIYVNSRNHRLSATRYLESIPVDCVGQIHVAGHSKSTKHPGLLIDTHDAPVPKEVWKLYRAAINRFGLVSSMVERDGNFPEWSELEKELLHMEGLRHAYRSAQVSDSQATPL
jgi:uncharacterized protein (UPF0276 family)